MPGPLAIAGIAISAYNMLKGSPRPPQLLDSDGGSQSTQYSGDLGSILNSAGKYMNVAAGIRGNAESLAGQPPPPPPSQGRSEFLGEQSGLGEVFNRSNFYNDNAGGSNLYNSLKQGDTLQFGNFS